MAKSDATEADVLRALMMGTDIPFRTNPNRFIALHTQVPTDSSLANANEASYPNYQRVSVPVSNFTINASNECVNTADIVFPSAGAGSNQTIVAFSITTASSGATQIIYYAPLDTPITVTAGVQVVIPANGLVIREN